MGVREGSIRMTYWNTKRAMRKVTNKGSLGLWVPGEDEDYTETDKGFEDAKRGENR